MMSDEWVEMEFIRAEAEGRLIHIWAREVNNGQKHHYVVIDFYPYYYTKNPPRKKEGVLYTEPEPYKSIFGEKVFKVFVEHPGLVPKLRKENDYEADVPYIERFLIDTRIAGKFYIRRSKLDEEKIRVSDIKGTWGEET